MTYASLGRICPDVPWHGMACHRHTHPPTTPSSVKTAPIAAAAAEIAVVSSPTALPAEISRFVQPAGREPARIPPFLGAHRTASGAGVVVANHQEHGTPIRDVATASRAARELVVRDKQPRLPHLTTDPAVISSDNSQQRAAGDKCRSATCKPTDAQELAGM